MEKVRTPSIHEIPQRVLDRVWDNVTILGPDDCWPWKLSLGSHGYGQSSWGIEGGRSAGTTAHRVVWIAANGPIPDYMTVDHSCHNRPCCNPKHLRLKTNVDNARDNMQGMKTHCPRNHKYNEENTYVDPRGHRRCRPCMKITAEERIERKVAA